MRRYYFQLAPELREWFVLPVEEDRAHTLRAFERRGPSQILLTAASMVAVINAALAGCLVGMAARQVLGVPLWAAALAGATVAVAAVGGQVMVQRRAWDRLEAEL